MTFLCLLAARAQNEEELKAIAELEMAGLELQDECEFLASTYKSSLISNTFSEKGKPPHVALRKPLVYFLSVDKCPGGIWTLDESTL
jgi:hypothetical protein